MAELVLRVKKLRKEAELPQRQTEGSAGLDLAACIDFPAKVDPGDTGVFPTGIAVEIPQGYVGLLFSRSGQGVRYNVTLANSVGVIDSDYRGELVVVLHNHGKKNYVVGPGQRIAQLVVVPAPVVQVQEAQELSPTQRGDEGFGSTGW